METTTQQQPLAVTHLTEGITKHLFPPPSNKCGNVTNIFGACGDNNKPFWKQKESQLEFDIPSERSTKDASLLSKQSHLSPFDYERENVENSEKRGVMCLSFGGTPPDDNARNDNSMQCEASNSKRENNRISQEACDDDAVVSEYSSDSNDGFHFNLI